MAVRLLIADDDEIIREGLCRNIAWADHGIELVGSAANGTEAWQMVLRLCPEIILSDIRMPEMSGIDLARKVNESLPRCRVVLLTAYDDFEYARKALRERVVDYILKTESNDSILKAIKRAAFSIQDMEREELLTEKGRVLYEQSQLSRLLAVDRESTDALDENHVRALGIDFSHSTCRIGVIRMFSGQNNPRPSERIFDEGRALDICRALLEKQGYPSLCVGYEGYIVCFLPLDDSKEECCLEFWKVFIEMIHKLYGLSISIGVGRLCRSFDDIPDSFDDAVFAAEDCETAGDVQIWQPLDGPSESLAARIGKVRNFIQENYTDKNLTLNVLSSRIYLSPAYISTLFKRYIGKNFKSYLTFLRMKKACELLTESAFCTFEISEAIGYPNSQYFSVLFKKHTGMAPTEYREKFRKVVSGVPKLPFGSLAP